MTCDDIKLGVTSQYTQEQGCHLERPKQAGGMGWQEPHEIQQEQTKSPDLGLNKLLQWCRLGAAGLGISPDDKVLGVWVDSKLSVSQQCCLASCALGCVNRNIASQLMEETPCLLSPR